jgi:ABC-type branched-subunit amino acid transport system substrate-binding protein
VSGVTLDSPVVWAGGSLLPVPPRTVNYPKEVVIGGLVPTDYNSNTEEAKQFVTDITLAFDMAAKSVNAAGLFPGSIRLRVEVLPVDPSGSGSTITVTDVASAFVRRGLATNANTTTNNNNSRVNVLGFVGPYWSSNAIVVAREVSTPFRLPVISYNAYTSMLDNSTEFPYFVRVNPANSDISKVFGVFLRSMGWTRIAVVTDDDASTSVRLI